MLGKGSVVFGNWTVESEIGSGAFGTVYKIRREDFGEEYTAAMKVIRIPQDKDDKKRLYSEGMNDADIALYYKQIAGDFIKEIKLLSSLNGVTNIVDYKDHVIEPNEDFGYTIYIKMQLLIPLTQLLVGEGNNAKFLTNEEIIRLGKDICSALEVCERKRIIHRDIKIDNIFISEDGDYKLGDFGIARQLEATQGEMSKKGTLMYMAPEVFKGEKYDRTADIYSLGIVLYRLLNKNRAPFFPNYPQTIKFTDKEQANNRRLNGEVVPLINGLSDELNAILRKACAYNPRDRYQSASEFKAALYNISTLTELDNSDIYCYETNDFVEPGTMYRDFMDSIGKIDIITLDETVGSFVSKNSLYNNVSGKSQSTYKSLAELKQEKREENEKKESLFAKRMVVETVSDDASDGSTVSIFDDFFDKEPEFIEEQTQDVFKVTPIAVTELSDTFFEKDTVTLFEPDEGAKIEPVFSELIVDIQAEDNEPNEGEKKNIGASIIIIVLILLVAVGIFFFMNMDDGKSGNTKNKTTTIEQANDNFKNINSTEQTNDTNQIPAFVTTEILGIESTEFGSVTSFDIPTTIPEGINVEDQNNQNNNTDSFDCIEF